MSLVRELALRIGKRLRRLLRSDRGSVSVEFVIAAPIMLIVTLGFTETYMYMRAVSAVDRTAFTLANSIGQMQSVILDDTDINDANSTGSIWQDAALLAAPYTLKGNGMVYVTSVCDMPSGATTCKKTGISMTPVTPVMRWTASPSGWTKNTNMASQVSKTNLLPATWPFRATDSAIVVEVYMSYNAFTMTSNFMSGLPGQTTIYRRVYVRPRSGLPIEPR